jgi:hypothetical protein
MAGGGAGNGKVLPPSYNLAGADATMKVGRKAILTAETQRRRDAEEARSIFNPLRLRASVVKLLRSVFSQLLCLLGFFRARH